MTFTVFLSKPGDSTPERSDFKIQPENLRRTPVRNQCLFSSGSFGLGCGSLGGLFGSGFSGSSRGGGFGGAGAKTDTPRGGGTFGGRPSGTARNTSFGGTSSRTSQKTEVSQTGTAGTGTPSVAGKPGVTASGPQPGVAGMSTRSTQRPPASEPRHSRNVPPPSAMPPSGAQSSSPVQQEHRQASGKDKPPVKGGGSVTYPGMAGTAPGSCTPPGQKLGGGPSKQKPMRQTKRKEGPTSV